MNFELKPGEKFACIAFENLAIDRSLSMPISLGEGLWTLPKHPFDLDKHWREWIGKIKADQTDRCNFFLLAVRASNRPGILDDENQALQKRLNRLLYGLLLQGIPNPINGFVLSGARISGETEIRQYAAIRDIYNSNPPQRVKWSERTCRTAKLFEEGYKGIEESSVHTRFKRGMSALVRGIGQPVIDERIHEYVRSLEALVKPQVSKSTNQFTHRCQTFAAASVLTNQILRDCYMIRSAVEHMNSVDDVLAGSLIEQKEALAGKRLRQIEKLAFDVYLKLATSKSQGQIFETDLSIDGFWSLQDHERRARWGKPLDITKVS